MTPRPSFSRPVAQPPKSGMADLILTPVIACFFLVNFVLWVAGITVMSLGVVAYTDEETMDALSGIDPSSTLNSFDYTGLMQKVAAGFMICGAILMIIGFLGCCGVAIGNTFLIYLYGIFVILVIILELTGLAALLYYKDSLPAALKVELEDSVKNYQGPVKFPSVQSRALDLIHQMFKCCGVLNGKDFVRSVWYNKTRKGSQRVPLTCCELKKIAGKNVPVNPRCQIDAVSNKNPYTNTGCHEALKYYVYEDGMVSVIITGCLLGMQLMAICCAAVVEKSYRDHEIAHKGLPPNFI